MKRISATLYLLLAGVFGLAPFLFETGEEASSAWTPFLASFHPLVLHLPIGILAALIALEAYSILKKSGPTAARDFLWLLTAIAASISFATGYLLGEEGGYDTELLNDHLWAAAIFTSLCWSTLAVNRLLQNPLIRVLSLAVLALTVVFASHPGGIMVHGDPFAIAPWKSKPTPSPKPKYTTSTNALESFNPYTTIIHPIIEAKCVACHGPEKKKGKLRLDSYEALMRGGDFGPCVEPGDSFNSLFIELIELPLDDEDRMPPEDEPQLTSQEIEALKWWIDAGASPDTIIEASDAPPPLQAILKSNNQFTEGSTRE